MPGEDGAGTDLAGGLFAPIVVPVALIEATSERAFLQALLDAEAALAQAEEEVGILPPGTAAAITQACHADLFDLDELGSAARLGGNPAIPLVSALRRVLKDNSDWVHFGATSQDIIDTASMLVAKRATALIETDLAVACDACASLCERHRSTLMVGRTLLQHALPITFGLKAAGWLVAATECRALLGLARKRLAVQLGGAAGTLASLGDQGTEVISAMARSLELGEPVLPWHTNRTTVAELASCLGILAGVGAKISKDVALMMQTEVREAFEPGAPGRGGSSTLPQKRNPVAAAAVASAHRRSSALVSVILSAMDDEHERALGGWQAEWETMVQLLRLCGGAISHVCDTLGGLEVDTHAMAENLAISGDAVLAERVVLNLLPSLGRSPASDAVARALERAQSSGRGFRAELLDDAAVASVLSQDRLSQLLEPSGYLGSTQAFIDAALRAHREAR
ncbi:MAG: 3-carboxy-cis,cis-muconate cycloisomerase [Acidimicrobiales bacterium]